MNSWRRLIPHALLGFIAVYAIWTLPVEKISDWHTSPFLFPLLIALVLLMLSVVDARATILEPKIRSYDGAAMKTSRALGLFFSYTIYPMLLLPSLPFDVATLIFLTALVILLIGKEMTLAMFAALAGFSVFLPIFFHYALLLPLPGIPALCLVALSSLGF